MKNWKKITMLLFSILLIGGCCMFKEDPGRFCYERKDPTTGKWEKYSLIQPASSRESTSFAQDGDAVDVRFGAQYNVSKIKAAFAAMRFWHILGGALVLLGIYMAYSRKMSSMWSVVLIGAGLGLGVFAHIVPTYGFQIMCAMGVLLAVGIGYVIWRQGLFKDKPPEAQATSS